MSDWLAFSSDGHEVEWTHADGATAETISLAWDNEAWTVRGQLAEARAEYVLRLSPTWRVRQFLLFRDLEDPDLWLATDGHGRWGEINGAHRAELDGIDDLDVVGATFPVTIPLRRLPLAVGDSAEVPVITVCPETLAVIGARRRYERIGERRWRRWRSEDDQTDEFDVDDHGVVIDDSTAERRRRR